MDLFRQFQKTTCKDGSSNSKKVFGCPCCRKFSNLNIFKKWSRKYAKNKLRLNDRKNLNKDF